MQKALINWYTNNVNEYSPKRNIFFSFVSFCFVLFSSLVYISKYERWSITMSTFECWNIQKYLKWHAVIRPWSTIPFPFEKLFLFFISFTHDILDVIQFSNDWAKDKYMEWMKQSNFDKTWRLSFMEMNVTLF